MIFPTSNGLIQEKTSSYRQVIKALPIFIGNHEQPLKKQKWPKKDTLK